jgi:thiosulfate dehydrogenase [quinone] large subunit
MKALESSSPVGALLRLSLHAPTLVGILIALGELAVALGILAGLWTRLAAVGGMLLSLTFFLTVSWSTTPYYYGSDIAFLFAWSVFALSGAGGVLSLDAWIDARAATAASSDERMVDELRRKILIGARSTALLAGVAAVLGGATAAIGRAAGGTRGGARQTLTTGSPRTAPSPASPSPHATRHRAPGTALAPVSAVPVGEGRQFTDPASGQPAWLLRPSGHKVAAFSAVCTHAGCTIGYDPNTAEFVCPCHGGRFSARTGAVIAGPPPTPLAKSPARVVNNEIRVD